MSAARYAVSLSTSAEAASYAAADTPACAQSAILIANFIAMTDFVIGGAHTPKKIKKLHLLIVNNIYNLVVVVGIVENFFYYARVGKIFLITILSFRRKE